MYCVCAYCPDNHCLSEMATRFSVSVSALTQARNLVAKNITGLYRIFERFGEINYKNLKLDDPDSQGLL